MFPKLWKWSRAPFCACCLLVTKLLDTGRSVHAVLARLPILEYHDLTLSRFSRYVWIAAGRARLLRPYSRKAVYVWWTALCPYLQSWAWRGPEHWLGRESMDFTILRICADISQCRNRGKSKWRNRRRRAGSGPTDIDDYYWTTSGRAGPVHIADPGMWKWLPVNQLNRKIPFLQHLGSIVSARCSVFQVTGECL